MMKLQMTTLVVVICAVGQALVTVAFVYQQVILHVKQAQRLKGVNAAIIFLKTTLYIV
jgi:hypothetical protein